MRATDLKDVTVRVPGSCGELLQGWHGGEPFLVTCPIARYTTVRASATLQGLVGLGEKSRRALQLYLREAGIEKLPFGMRLTSELPRGKGMASSSADIAAVLAAASHALGQLLAPEALLRLAVQVEPTDAVFLAGIVCLNQVTGHVQRTYRSLSYPQLTIFDTGGTVDKLESIPGYQTALSREKFFDTVNKCGVSVIGQSGNLAPADKKLYALRDVTATVDCIPLIASSIMSKKLAAGSDCILLDVKTGSGAFMKTLDDSIKLAQTMVAIGELAGRRTVALITDMDTPLGYGIGNSIEVMESMDVLKGEGPADLREVSLQLASNMLYLVGKGTPEECRAMAEKSIEDGSAFETFCTMVRAQGGDDSVLRDYTKFPQAPYRAEIKAERSGYITKMNAEEIGETSVVLGAGRETKESTIDFSAGLILHKKYGDEVKEGDSLVTLYTSKESALADAEKMYREAIAIGDEQPVKEPLVYARVEKDKVEKY